MDDVSSRKAETKRDCPYSLLLLQFIWAPRNTKAPNYNQLPYMSKTVLFGYHKFRVTHIFDCRTFWLTKICNYRTFWLPNIFDYSTYGLTNIFNCRTFQMPNIFDCRSVLSEEHFQILFMSKQVYFGQPSMFISIHFEFRTLSGQPYNCQKQNLIWLP